MDFAYVSVEFECPGCGFSIQVLMRQVIVEETVICQGCLSEIKLVDDDGSNRTAQREIHEALDNMNRRLRRFGGS